LIAIISIILRLVYWEYSGGENAVGFKVSTRKPVCPVQKERRKEQPD